MEDEKLKIRVGLIVRLHNAGLGVDDLANAWGLSLKATCLKLCGVTKTFINDYFTLVHAYPQLNADGKLFDDLVIFHEDKKLGFIIHKKERKQNGNKFDI